MQHLCIYLHLDGENLHLICINLYLIRLTEELHAVNWLNGGSRFLLSADEGELNISIKVLG